MKRLAAVLLLCASWSQATVYYVSSDSGNDGNTGLTPQTAFETISHVNSLNLLPGDEVRFLCGETWRIDPLMITQSGEGGLPIIFTSEPLSCVDKPLLSGAWPVGGWVLSSQNIWMADLAGAPNAPHFPSGLNQLFAGSDRLPFGRWPDRQGHANGGWAGIDSHNSGNQITDAELPNIDWTGAVAHIRGMTWYILNRPVMADAGDTLTLGTDIDCYGGCGGWGYYLSNHIATLSREGEWYWDEATNRVYLFSSVDPNTMTIEGSAVIPSDSSYHGGIVLGRHLYEHISSVTIENLRVERWFQSGVSTPVNLELDDNHDLVLDRLEIRDVDDAGLRLTTWVWNAGSDSGWRGGHNMSISNIVIERANHFGIDSYAYDSQFSNIRISDVALIENLGKTGMGCGDDTSGGFCTESGAGIRLKRHLDDFSSHSLTFSGLDLNNIGMNGIDVFGDTITIADSVIKQTCVSKSDCGAIRTFGAAPIGTSPVHDVQINDVIIQSIHANNDGCHSDYRYPLGFGLYIDHYSRDVSATRVTASDCRPTGILFQNSTGSVQDSIVYDTAFGTWGGTSIRVVGASQMQLYDSVVFSTDPTVTLVGIDTLTHLTAADRNEYFNPWDTTSLCLNGNCFNLADWQSTTGLDNNSHEQWYTLQSSDSTRSKLFTNPTEVTAPANLEGLLWYDLEQNPVGSLVLAPFASRVLIQEESVIFVDGFESGDMIKWSTISP